jgi:hypothetical protein
VHVKNLLTGKPRPEEVAPRRMSCADLLAAAAQSNAGGDPYPFPPLFLPLM